MSLFSRHACSMCNQRFAESILLNDHIVKAHLNMNTINPTAPFTQTQPPAPTQFANVQGEPQLPQIASVSSLSQFPQQTINPIPSTATSSYSQSPMAPGPSTSGASGSAQGSVSTIFDDFGYSVFKIGKFQLMLHVSTVLFVITPPLPLF